MRVEAIHTVVEPIAREFLIVSGISGVEREAPDKEKAQEQSGEECRKEMLVERLLEHIGDRKGIRIAQALYPEVVGAPGFEPGASCARRKSRNAKLLVRLAFSYVLHHGF